MDTMAGISVLATSNENSRSECEKLCGPCCFSNRTTVAVFWCKRCLEAMCENCTANHERFQHEIISIEEIAKETSLNLQGVDEVSRITDDFINKEEKCEPMDVMEIAVNKVISIDLGRKITGGTILPDGGLVLCHGMYRNSKLKIYDKSGNCFFEKQYGINYPRDACLIPSSCNTFLVSLFSQKILQKYEIQQNTVKEIGTITCKPYPWGLAASKENIIVGYGSEIDVMSMTGMVIRGISRRGDNLSYVAVSLSGNVYYTDNNNIVCATSGGNEVRRFTYPDVKSLTGIAVDGYENVYACGYKIDNVAVLSADGQTSKILATGIGKPFKPCLDSTETKIIITTSKAGVHCYGLIK